MLTYLLHQYGVIALYLHALLSAHLFPELALVVAAAWPALVCIFLLAILLLYFTWQDHRAIKRHINRRLAALTRQAEEFKALDD